MRNQESVFRGIYSPFLLCIIATVGGTLAVVILQLDRTTVRVGL